MVVSRRCLLTFAAASCSMPRLGLQNGANPGSTRIQSRVRQAMTERVQVGGLQVAKVLFDFVNDEAIPVPA